MTFKPFEATIRQQSGVVTIDLHGEINAFAEEKLTNIYKEASHNNPEVMALNFNEVSYINSTGIALIVGLLAQARKSQIRLVVFGLSDHYEEIFRITRLSDFMSIFPDESSVLTGIA